MPNQNKEKFIPLSVPNMGETERRYVYDAVDTGWVSTGGPHVERFEQNIAAYVGAAGAVACQSGTAGLHLALLLAGVTAADVVLVPTLTFIAAVNPVTYVGAAPVFMDCDDSLCLDPVKLERFCREECTFAEGVLTEKASGRSVKAAVVVHVFGNLADMTAIQAIAHRYGLTVIEDATEALGSRTADGRYAGTLGDVGVYSFNGNKIITTGGGGMLVSRHEDWLRRARHLSTQAKSDPLYYTHDEVGYNYRMTNVQAALGLAQLERLETFVETKHRLYGIYERELAGCGLPLLGWREDTRPNGWFIGLVCESDTQREALLRFLDSHRVQTRPVWGLIHEQPPYAGARVYRVHRAVDYQRRVLNIPCSTDLTDEDAVYVASLIREFLRKGRGDDGLS